MASSVPYVAPYGSATARSRPGVNLKSPLARFFLTGLAMIVVYVAAQLALASVASTIIHDLMSLDASIATRTIERDSLVGRVEELKSLVKVEEWAAKHGYVPVTNIRFVR